MRTWVRSRQALEPWGQHYRSPSDEAIELGFELIYDTGTMGAAGVGRTVDGRADQNYSRSGIVAIVRG